MNRFMGERRGKQTRRQTCPGAEARVGVPAALCRSQLKLRVRIPSSLAGLASCLTRHGGVA
jgi:hypothetical protein